MEKMKTLNYALAAALMSVNIAAFAQSGHSDPEGSLVYSLPSTSVKLEVEARQETFHAGPYAKYAQKYLGVDARQQDATKFEVTSVKMTSAVEADPALRYTVNPGAGMPAFLALTSQGLVSIADAAAESTEWRFPSASKGDFSDKGLTSNLTSEAATLYRTVKSESAYNKVAVQQEMVVQKSMDARAKEAADMIFSLRKKKVQIITGDTDATFSGEAMASAVAEITRMENEYMSMFIGYSDFQTQKLKCDVVPVKNRKSQTYVAFRISDTDGIVSADNMSGKPYLLEIVPQPIGEASGKGAQAKSNVAIYRIPAICTVRLSDGVTSFLQDRMAIYQLGTEGYFPLSK